MYHLTLIRVQSTTFVFANETKIAIHVTCKKDMDVYVLLNLLNELMIRDKCEASMSFTLLFRGQ